MKQKHDNLIVDEAFKHYRERGFPYIKLANHEIWQEFDKLIRLGSEISTVRGILGREYRLIGGSVGQKICYHFMPHEFDVEVGGKITPVVAFNDDRRLKILFRLCLKERMQISDVSVLSFLKIVRGSQFATNFRPSVAKAIYNNWGGGIVYDFSSGFGGRLLGFLACDFAYLKRSRYIGVEPATKTYNALNKMVRFFGVEDKVTLYKMGAEDFCPDELRGKVRLAFSSPPYFSKEHYSTEPTQSYLKFPEYEQWRRRFLFRVLEKSYRLLKPGGIFIINIADVNIGNVKYPLVSDTHKFASKIFSEELPRLYMCMGGYGRSLNKKKNEIFLLFKK